MSEKETTIGIGTTLTEKVWLQMPTKQAWAKLRYKEVAEDTLRIMDGWIDTLRKIGKDEDAEIIIDIRFAIWERAGKVFNRIDK